MKELAVALTISISLFCAAPSFAQAPTLINFQGKLTDTALAPVDGKVDIVCSVFDAAGDGTLLWSEQYPAVPVNKGIFNVLLGNGLPDTYAAPGPLYAGLAEVFAAHPEAWLQVEILDKTRTPLQWETMTPRQRLVSVAYSLHSQTAQTAQTAATADDVPGKDITPNSVRIPHYGLVIDSDGKWVGDPTGLTGPQGPQGEKGETGPQGQVGPVGPQGQTGLQGIQGATGLKGDQGIQGKTGPQGPQGVAGPAGGQGPAGPRGSQGQTGATGPTGPQGPPGETGGAYQGAHCGWWHNYITSPGINGRYCQGHNPMHSCPSGWARSYTMSTGDNTWYFCVKL